jgi:hypothetical protein
MWLCDEISPVLKAYASRPDRRCIEVFCACLQMNEAKWNERNRRRQCRGHCGWMDGAKAGWGMRCFGSKTGGKPAKPTAARGNESKTLLHVKLTIFRIYLHV